MNRRSARLLLVSAVVTVLLAGCGMGQEIFSNVGSQLGGGDAGGVPAADGGQAREEAAAPPGDDDASGPMTALIEQRIVKTGEITIEVDNVGSSLGLVRAMATELGGYVGGSQAGTLDDRATLTLRIPAARFDEALARLHELDGEVVAEATREQDVTGQIVDLEARIENLEASEATYRELVARATEIEDILAVQSRLDQVRAEIEQMTAQLETIGGQADLSTLTVTVVPAAAPVAAQTETWDPGAQVDAAVAALLGIGQGLLTGLIWLGVVVLPMGLVLGLVVLLVVRGGLELRRRVPPTPTQPAPEERA